MNPTRRLFIATTGLGIPAFGLVGCTTSKNGNVTTVTINVAEVDAYAQAAGKGLALFADVAGPAIGPAATEIVNAADTAITVAAANFDKAVAGSLTVTVDSTSLATLVSSVSAAAGKVAAAVGQSFTGTGLSAQDQQNAQTYLDAFQTAVALIQDLVAMAGKVGAVAPKMAPAAMFSAVGMKVLGVPSVK